MENLINIVTENPYKIFDENKNILILNEILEIQVGWQTILFSSISEFQESYLFHMCEELMVERNFCL